MTDRRSPAEEYKEYAESMSTVEHLDVIAEQIESGEGSDFEVIVSLLTVVHNLGAIVAKDQLTFDEATDFVESRQRLNIITTAVDKQIFPDNSESAMYLGFLAGVKGMISTIVDIKAQ